MTNGDDVTDTAGRPVRILLADDQPLLRTGFRMVLGAEDDLDIVGEAGDGAEAVELARRLQPDVVLMDIRMPRMDGVAATRALGGGTSPTAAARGCLGTNDSAGPRRYGLQQPRHGCSRRAGIVHTGLLCCATPRCCARMHESGRL